MMTIAVMNYVWEHSKSKGLTRLVLLAIADNANEQGDAFPGITRIAKKCNASERSVQNAISELENAGELMVFPQVGMKTISGRTNLYRVVMEGVKAELPRNEHGEIVTARQPKQAKKRSFPDGVQPASPLQGVQTASPHGVQLDSPDGVQPVSPKPSALPQLNSSTPLTPRKRGKGQREQVTTDFLAQPIAVRLHELFSNGIEPSRMTVNAIKQYLNAAYDLLSCGASIETVNMAYANLQKKATEENWRGFGLNGFMKHYPQMIAPAPKFDLLKANGMTGVRNGRS